MDVEIKQLVFWRICSSVDRYFSSCFIFFCILSLHVCITYSCAFVYQVTLSEGPNHMAQFKGSTHQYDLTQEDEVSHT